MFVNDTFGHAFGDFLLKTLGQRLQENTRSMDLVGRVGGDECLVFLQDIPSNDTLMGRAKLLLSSISEEVRDGESCHSINGSIGVAIFPEHGSTYEELYHHADISLYNSKHRGKNTVTLFQQDMKQEER